MNELLSKVQPHTTNEEKLLTDGGCRVLRNAGSSQALDKGFGRSKDESECRPHLRFNSYTPLNTLQERISNECENMEFKELRIRN